MLDRFMCAMLGFIVAGVLFMPASPDSLVVKYPWTGYASITMNLLILLAYIIFPSIARQSGRDLDQTP